MSTSVEDLFELPAAFAATKIVENLPSPENNEVNFASMTAILVLLLMAASFSSFFWDVIVFYVFNSLSFYIPGAAYMLMGRSYNPYSNPK